MRVTIALPLRRVLGSMPLMTTSCNWWMLRVSSSSESLRVCVVCAEARVALAAIAIWIISLFIVYLYAMLVLCFCPLDCYSWQKLRKRVLN